jgi:hypothetical protein
VVDETPLATSANQPGYGTAGSPSTNVSSVTGRSLLTIPLVCDGSGNLDTYGPAIGGDVVTVVLAQGTLAATTDITLTGETTGQPILTLTNVTAGGLWRPRGPTHDLTGVATGALDAVGVVGRVHIVVAQGGPAGAGTLYLFVEAA